MADVINLLPDSIANQIAAGEVIQRPASVIKELIENAIDAEATEIKIIIKDAGKTLIQVIDNGKGMSDTDARMAFERHATSKIKKADDLFSLSTMGFRGEALASIAAIAHVELKTKQQDADLGTYINIQGSKVVKQEFINCEKGSNFVIKNLFFNVPARRKFLKSTNTEFKHILEEFQRIALTYENIKFVLKHNNTEIYNIAPESKLKRIISIFNTGINSNLLKLETKTDKISISGYIGKPQNYRKTSGHQYFFVNKRFMKHPYFYKAVTKAYENLIPQNTYPSFFIYFDVNPKDIDVNIHPTKTEIKFVNEFDIWQILNAAVREALGKHNMVPSLDFNNPLPADFSTSTKSTKPYNPKISINPDYNPFDNEKTIQQQNQKDNIENWDMLYTDLNNIENNEQEKLFGKSESDETTFLNQNSYQSQLNKFILFKSKYILTSVKSGLMIINIKRAHQRIIYDYYLNNIKSHNKQVQKLLYPKKIELSPKDFITLKDLYQSLQQFGFEINIHSENNIEITGVPNDFSDSEIEKTFEQIFEKFTEQAIDTTQEIQELIALEIAKTNAINPNQQINQENLINIFNNLFNCSEANYTPEGKKIIEIIETKDIDKLF